MTARAWRLRNAPILLKVLLTVAAVGVGPLLLLSAAEIVRAGRRASGADANLPALFLSVALFLCLLGAAALAQEIVRPLRALQQAAARITEGGEASLDLDRDDEIGRLAHAFQRLLEKHARSEDALRRERDVLARLMSENRSVQLQLQALLDNCPAPVFIKNLEGRYIFINRMYEAAIRRTSAEVRGLTVRDIYPGEIGDVLFARDMDVLRHGCAVRSEDLLVQHGVQRSYLSVRFPLPDATGNPVALCGIANDITDRKEMEEQLRQSQKLQAIGRLAGGVAHDFNNLLTVILGYADVIADAVAQDPPLRESVGEVRKAATRASALTQQLLAFSRRQVLQPSVFDLNAVVRDIERMLRRLIGENIALETACDGTPCAIRADRAQLEQVLVNLAVNARDAMPAGGRLSIETRVVVLDADFAGRHLLPAPGPHVELVVSDTGVGMDPETQARAFEPFFTTKESGHGTGLGLATVYGIVRQSDGSIVVESAPGRGTTFRIFLPRCAAPIDATGPVPALEAPAHDGPELRETVLLVEDEEGVRELVRRTLHARGYTVLEAADGETALVLASDHGGRIDLLLSDVVMPGITGVNLATELVAARPGLRVLLMSGYTAQHSGAWITDPRHYLQKPFTPDALATKVREVLDDANA